MTYFINLRATPSGGFPADEASVLLDGRTYVARDLFSDLVRGRDLVFVTHGFNVGQDSGVKSLRFWGEHYRLPGSADYIGVLWPGDSRFLPILDYPVEGEVAMQSARVFAAFLDRWAAGAASVSFVSHSLGARMVLETIRRMARKEVRRVVLMAGAIEDDCLTNEYRDATGKAQQVSVVASLEDWVLKFAFPIGNPVGEIVMRGHPYFNAALGRRGPAEPIPLAKQGPTWQAPVPWDLGHLDYTPDNPGGPQIDPPQEPPRDAGPVGPATPPPVDPRTPEWKSSWTAAVASTQLE